MFLKNNNNYNGNLLVSSFCFNCTMHAQAAYVCVHLQVSFRDNYNYFINIMQHDGLSVMVADVSVGQSPFALARRGII